MIPRCWRATTWPGRGVALGEGPAGMRYRVEHLGGPGVQRRGWVAELVQRGVLAVGQVPVARPQPPHGRADFVAHGRDWPRS